MHHTDMHTLVRGRPLQECLGKLLSGSAQSLLRRNSHKSTGLVWLIIVLQHVRSYDREVMSLLLLRTSLWQTPSWRMLSCRENHPLGPRAPGRPRTECPLCLMLDNDGTAGASNSLMGHQTAKPLNAGQHHEKSMRCTQNHPELKEWELCNMSNRPSQGVLHEVRAAKMLYTE